MSSKLMNYVQMSNKTAENLGHSCCRNAFNLTVWQFSFPIMCRFVRYTLFFRNPPRK